jgi:hypothetical protein
MSTTSFRAVLAVACAAVAMSACGHHIYGSASAAPGKPLDAASLIVSLDDMRRLTGLPGLVKGHELNAEPRQGGYGQVPVPCRAVSMMDPAEPILAAWGVSTDGKRQRMLGALDVRMIRRQAPR